MSTSIGFLGIAAVWAVASAPTVSASQLLETLDLAPAGAHSPMQAPNGIQFVIQFRSLIDPGFIEYFGRDVTWPDNDSGNFDFTSVNSNEFLQLSFIVTNGVDDDLGFLIRTPDGNLGGGHSGTESSFGLGTPDLVGNQIDFIRLVVHDLSIQPFMSPFAGEGIQWDAHITWEFWGTPIPEPATVCLLALGALILRKRR